MVGVDRTGARDGVRAAVDQVLELWRTARLTSAWRRRIRRGQRLHTHRGSVVSPGLAAVTGSCSCVRIAHLHDGLPASMVERGSLLLTIERALDGICHESLGYRYS